jgi:hypothetical protein
MILIDRVSRLQYITNAASHRRRLSRDEKSEISAQITAAIDKLGLRQGKSTQLVQTLENRSPITAATAQSSSYGNALYQLDLQAVASKLSARPEKLTGSSHCMIGSVITNLVTVTEDLYLASVGKLEIQPIAAVELLHSGDQLVVAVLPMAGHM